MEEIQVLNQLINLQFWRGYRFIPPIYSEFKGMVCFTGCTLKDTIAALELGVSG